MTVFHQAGKENFKNLELFYEKRNLLNFLILNILDDIFKKVDFCITRAGASTLAELVFFNVPFLAVPFPFSKDNHQLYNAQFYKKHNCCWIIEQKDILKETFYETISNIINDKKEIEIKKRAMIDFSEKNTWENNNKLIIKTINEN